jgi:hypothetical protein
MHLSSLHLLLLFNAWLTCLRLAARHSCLLSIVRWMQCNGRGLVKESRSAVDGELSGPVSRIGFGILIIDSPHAYLCSPNHSVYLHAAWNSGMPFATDGVLGK